MYLYKCAQNAFVPNIKQFTNSNSYESEYLFDYYKQLLSIYKKCNTCRRNMVLCKKVGLLNDIMF